AVTNGVIRIGKRARSAHAEYLRCWLLARAASWHLLGAGLLLTPLAVQPRVVDRPVAYGGDVVFSPDHRTVAIAEEDHSLPFVDFENASTTGLLKRHAVMISAAAFSCDR